MKIDETLRYPTKSHKRKSANQARKRATVFGEHVFQDKLDMALKDDMGLYNLIDECTKEILYTDLISIDEAKIRNEKLEQNNETFKWTII